MYQKRVNNNTFNIKHVVNVPLLLRLSLQLPF